MLSSSLVIIALAALAASLLTLISGFGLGTLLLPVFALFFPIQEAIALTAVVHLLNNVFKFGILRHHVDRDMVLRFGIPSILGAFLGAFILRFLGKLAPAYMGINGPVGPLELTIGLLMVLFAFLEFFPVLEKVTISKRMAIAGGAVSGFFGGISGHQGALRSMFLLHSGISKEAYIATGIAIALLVDLTRIPVYLAGWDMRVFLAEWPALLIAIGAAFLGAYWGKRLIPKVTFRAVRILVGLFLLLIGGGMVAGLFQ